MNTLEEIIDKRNELFEKMMDNYSFMMIYNGDLMGDEDEEELMKKIQKLDDGINKLKNDECGCGEHMRLAELRELISEIEEYI